MKLLSTVAGLSSVAGAAAAAAAATQSPLSIFDNSVESRRIPSSYESAVMGRRILALTKLGTLSTVFPQTSAHEQRPGGMQGQPVGLMDYVADCEDEGNPTILALRIGTTFMNVAAGSNITLSMRWTPPYPPAKRMSLLSRLAAYVPFLSRHCPYDSERTHSDLPDTVPYSAANLPRFSLFGYLEKIEADDDKAKDLAVCYTAKHRDARYWLPGNHIHQSEWARLVVTHVYWIGGFGDRAYIGWIPVEEWKHVTKEDWEAIELPGEKKDWDEWHLGQSEEL
ncbi:FMN-binding split barrel-related protein [Metarhizium album ARSEF 1941]|uniref:FMN-binding split barrel-related protein n=1 Tax=Metarhizium album (strain ARSEF 1941) TaxID=1081103 RepID=A0A0B2WRU2_METAS|nr:FMN-binding split barrel-related protein [Metarhizium album ARSEF 1941]KHN98756.1 FMN-binding split barrel-related protein [Metarhizium album ARSEF 1941]